MLVIRRVLVPTDFSALADVAIEQALELCERHGAVLHMLHAVVLHADDPNDPAHHFPDSEEIQGRLEEIAASRMEVRLEAAGSVDVEVVRAQRRGIAAAPVILEYAAEVEADVIVMSTHGRRGLGRAFLGSVTEEVVRVSEIPVLTVRRGAGEERGPGFESVLVPVDFSEHSAQAIRYASGICRSYGARLHVVHVFEPPIHPEVYIGGGSVLPDFRTLETDLTSALADFATGAGAAEAVTHVVEGRAVSGILDVAAESGTDLIVIATHGLTGLKHVLLGSVAERVVRRAMCPVLTVKVFGRSILHD
jgi:nucleotide-binding universal stress UspA family protein